MRASIGVLVHHLAHHELGASFIFALVKRKSSMLKCVKGTFVEANIEIKQNLLKK